MHSAQRYTVTLHEASSPHFDQERRYILAEKEYIQRQLKALGNRIWPFFSYPGLNIFRPVDWKRYDHELDKYGHALDKHERGLGEEFIPFKLFVTNHGDEPDQNIEIHVAVEHGIVSEKKAPERPKRIDAVKSPSKDHFRLPKPGGFLRSGIRIKPRSIEAKFSQLDAHDSADLVHAVLFLHGDERTKLRFEIRSRGLGAHVERGEVLPS